MNSPLRKKLLGIYLAGAFGQIAIACIFVWVMKVLGIPMGYSSIAGYIAIAIGGTSTAIWGTLVSKKYSGNTVVRIFKDFFAVNQSLKSYVLLLIFLFIDFAYLFFGGRLQINAWYIPFALFFKAILFGGIEEIGWRYTFQPILEEKLNYILATLITFICWGIWHFAFFYIDGTLVNFSVNSAIHFCIGLLVNSFILSAVFCRIKSLWLCVMGHSLINVLSQLANGGNQIVAYGCQLLIVIAAVYYGKYHPRFSGV